MAPDRPVVLSLAGLDPSGGAGLLADIKTFEAHEVYGLGVCSAQTIQTEKDFISIRWEEEQDIIKALETMLSNYEVRAIKVGIIENIMRLKNIVSFIHQGDPAVKIVLDPVIRSTSGFDFWRGEVDAGNLKGILQEIFLITPNYSEAVKLMPAASEKESAKLMSSWCNVLLKGGHNEEETGVDHLYTRTELQTLTPTVTTVSAKHGSGCVLSAAIAANLALGHDLRESCLKAKQYIERFLISNDSLLGYHHV